MALTRSCGQTIVSTTLAELLKKDEEAWFVNEFGVYTLILGSEKKESKQFKRWLTHEVLPAIRRTGSYGILQDSSSSHSSWVKTVTEDLAFLKNEMQAIKS